MKKKLFIESIEKLKEQSEHDRKCTNAFEIVFPDDWITGYDNSFITNQIIKILQITFKDKSKWVEYFIYDLNFGKDYKPGMVTEKDGENIELSTSENLYDLLISNLEN